VGTGLTRGQNFALVPAPVGSDTRRIFTTAGEIANPTKKGGMTVIRNEKNEFIPQRTATGWRICIDYWKLNKATRKDYFSLPFIDKMLERLANHSFFCYLDGYSGYHQILIHPDDQSKTTFTCPCGTFAYRRMSFGLCNTPAPFQRCMMAIFSDLIEKVCASRPSRYVSVINDNHLVSLMNFNAPKVD
jgi:hypothetical protein